MRRCAGILWNNDEPDIIRSSLRVIISIQKPTCVSALKSPVQQHFVRTEFCANADNEKLNVLLVNYKELSYRAAGWVRCGQKWKTEIGRQYLRTPIFNHCDVFGQQRNRNQRKKRKIRAITPFKVIQGYRGRYQSKARMRLPISD